MNESISAENDGLAADPEPVAAGGIPPDLVLESPDGVVVIITMRPERVFGARRKKKGEKAKKGNPAAGVSRRYRTGSWTFAGDFLDRVAENVAGVCGGLAARPVAVELVFAVEDETFRQVGLLVDAADRAHRGF